MRGIHSVEKDIIFQQFYSIYLNCFMEVVEDLNLRLAGD